MWVVDIFVSVLTSEAWIGLDRFTIGRCSENYRHINSEKSTLRTIKIYIVVEMRRLQILKWCYYSEGIEMKWMRHNIFFSGSSGSKRYKAFLMVDGEKS